MSDSDTQVEGNKGVPRSERKRNVLTSTRTSDGRGEIVRNGDWVIVQFPDGSKKLCRILRDKDMKVMGKRVLCDPIIGTRYGSTFQLENDAEATEKGKKRNATMHKQMEEARERKRMNGRPQKSLSYAALRLVDMSEERTQANDRLLQQRLEELQADLKRTKELLSINSSGVHCSDSTSDGGNSTEIVATHDGAARGMDNRAIVDDNQAQKLSAKDIQDLLHKSDGSAVVQALQEGSETFEMRTEFSKDKYIKRKMEKYVLRITVFPCVTQSIAEALYHKTTIPGGKLHGMRWDTVPLLLNAANVHPGGTTMVVDTVMGLMLGAVMERQGGEGTIYSVFYGRQQVRSGIQYFNFTADELSTIQFRNSLALGGDSPAWDTVQAAMAEVQEEEDNALAIQERKEFQPVPEASVDSLLIVTDFLPAKILLPMLKYLAPSRPFAVYFRSSEPLVECLRILEKTGSVCDMRVSENILAEHQVLPARTHPEMRTTSYGGYMLTGTTIIPDQKPEAAIMNEPERKRTKME